MMWLSPHVGLYFAIKHYEVGVICRKKLNFSLTHRFSFLLLAIRDVLTRMIFKNISMYKQCYYKVQR